VVDDVLIDSETILVTNFVNLKIKLVQSFEYAHKDRVYMHDSIYIYIYIYCVSKKTQFRTSDLSQVIDWTHKTYSIIHDYILQ
jgi:hypothetical protein